MKKILLVLIAFSLYLNADTMYQNGKCVSDYYTKDSSTIFLNYSNGGSSTVSSSKSKLEGLVLGLNKYELVNGRCQLISSTFGMSAEYFYFLSGLSGLLTAYLLVSLIARKV